MLFLQEVARQLQSAQARGLKPNMDGYRPLQSGEEVVGTITDSALLALVVLVDKAEAEFLLRWPTPPTNAVAMGHALAAGAEKDELTELVHLEIRRMLSMGPEDPVVLRQGYGGPVVVKPAALDTPPNGLTVVAIEAARAARKVAVLKRLKNDLDEIAASRDCTPGCSVCAAVRGERAGDAFENAMIELDRIS